MLWDTSRPQNLKKKISHFFVEISEFVYYFHTNFTNPRHLWSKLVNTWIFLPRDTCSLQELSQIDRFFRGEIPGTVRTSFSGIFFDFATCTIPRRFCKLGSGGLWSFLLEGIKLSWICHQYQSLPNECLNKSWGTDSIKFFQLSRNYILRQVVNLIQYSCQNSFFKHIHLSFYYSSN